MNNTLESSKFFPYIAWVLVIGFAIFTYMLTVRVQEELVSISMSVERLETKIDSLGTPAVPVSKTIPASEKLEVQ